MHEARKKREVLCSKLYGMAPVTDNIKSLLLFYTQVSEIFDNLGTVEGSKDANLAAILRKKLPENVFRSTDFAGSPRRKWNVKLLMSLLPNEICRRKDTDGNTPDSPPIGRNTPDTEHKQRKSEIHLGKTQPDRT